MFERRWTLAAALLASCLALAAGADTVAKDLPARPGGSLILDLESGGSVVIRVWDRDQVSVRAERGGPDGEDVEVEIEPTSGGVRVETRYRGRRRSYTTDLDLAIQVPARFDVEVDSMGGGIDIDGLEGEVRGKTMGGDLDLRNLRGSLDLTTMGGAIHLTASEVDGDLHTMGGEVVFEDVVGDIDGSSMGGNVVYKNVQRRAGQPSGKRVEISTMGGDVEVEEAPVGARVRTQGGQIVVRSAEQFVDAETMGGDVRIERVDGDVKAVTMGGNVEVTFVGDPGQEGREIEMSSNGGEMELTVPAGMGLDIDVDLVYTRDSSRSFRIDSAFPLQVEEDAEWTYGHGSPRKHIRGTGRAGSGGNRVRIRTINGNVRIKVGS